MARGRCKTGVVEEGISEKIHVPKVPKDEQSSEAMLAPVDARPLLSTFRSSPEIYRSRRHVFLELAWHTGAWLSGLRGLDLRDFHPDEKDAGPYVEFRHHPESDTPLKNGFMESHGISNQPV